MTKQDTIGKRASVSADSFGDGALEPLVPPTGEVVLLHPARVGDVGEDDVERINPFGFYDFGKELQTLKTLPNDATPQAAFFPIWQGRTAMTNLLAGRPIPIGISAQKAREIHGALNSLMDDHFSMKNEKGETVLSYPDDKAEPISSWRISILKTSIEQFETIFAEEMRETATYFVPRRGIYYTPALVDSAEETFPKELLTFIPDRAKDDWKSAGRCLAFNLLSASGFHVARAVEACLESYYGLFSGKPGVTLHGWYDYIKELKDIAEKKPTPCPLDKTLVELDQMRTDYRNPIVHPRVVLSEGDARMLFANGESLIIAMAQELCEAAKGVQPTLALIGGKDAKEEGKTG